MPSAPTVDEAKETRNQLTELEDSAGFHIRKWISNEPDVIADVVEEDRASERPREERNTNNQDPGCPVGRHRLLIFL